MSGYYSRSDGLGIGQLGAMADMVPSQSPLGNLGQESTGNWWTNASPVQRGLYIAGLAAVPALAYHGYKRNDSVGWAIIWGLFGSMVWPITGPIAYAQGYAKPKRVQKNRRRSRSKTSRRRTSRRR